MYANHTKRIEQCRWKLGHCVRMARQNNAMFLELGGLEWRFMRDEAMRDARYWKRQLTNAIR